MADFFHDLMEGFKGHDNNQQKADATIDQHGVSHAVYDAYSGKNPWPNSLGLIGANEVHTQNNAFGSFELHDGSQVLASTQDDPRSLQRAAKNMINNFSLFSHSHMGGK